MNNIDWYYDNVNFDTSVKFTFFKIVLCEIQPHFDTVS